MENKTRRKRGPWIDITLIACIFALGTIIVFLTILNDDFKFQKTSASESDEIISDMTEEDSAFPGIRIVTDISDDPFMSFAILFPLTLSDSFNEAITTYIESSKNYYINAMRLQNTGENKEQTGELNISLETHQYNEQYYSFVLTNKTSLNRRDYETTVKTFFFNKETGELLDFHTLLNSDLKSLETFATHVRSEILKQPELEGLLIEENLHKATEAKWRLFKRFALVDDTLVLYFNEGEIADSSAGIPTLTIPLSFINPLLSTDFQIQMESAETIIPHEPTTNDKEKKHIALTFDDGPNPKVTKQILDLLEKYNAKATFFMLGSRVQYYPKLVQEVRDDGHEIGNHTWNHPVLTKLESAQILREFNSTEEAIFNVLGQHSTVFRPPYGAMNERVKGLIPIPAVNWTIDTLDWKHRDASQLLPIIQHSMHNNAIILMHDIHQSTADGLESVLVYLQQEGYEFLTVSEILQYH